MRKQRDRSATEDDDGRLISLQDKHDADRALQQAFAAGELDAEELKVRRGKLYERADKAEIRRSIRLQLAIVGFAIIITMFVLLGTIINNQGGTAGTRVFPWEWGSSDN